MNDPDKKEPVDPKVVSGLQDLMGDSFITVYEAFIRSCDLNMAELSAAVESDELELIHTIAHTLKGSSSNIGAVYFSDISHKMMDDAKNGVSTDYHAHLNHLNQEYERVRKSILTLLSD